jgi:hypothetical protein
MITYAKFNIPGALEKLAPLGCRQRGSVPASAWSDYHRVAVAKANPAKGDKLCIYNS